MKVIMLAGAPGSVDGFRVTQYEAGQEYDLTSSVGARDLAGAFIAAGLADEVGTTPAPASSVQRVEGDAVEVLATEGEVAVVPVKPGRKPKAQ